VRVLTGLPLMPGVAEGDLLALSEPLSFWGGYDATSGRIIDRWHPDHGRSCAAMILAMRASRGSSSGSSVLAEAIRAGVAPAAILIRERDPIVTVGAMVAAELYGIACPVVVVAPQDWAGILAFKRLRVEAAEGAVRLIPLDGVCLHDAPPL
jgi:predicted aconitase with swiveling domain